MSDLYESQRTRAAMRRVLLSLRSVPAKVAADAVTERGRERLLAAIEAWTQRAQEAGHPRAADQNDALTHLATLVLTRPVSITEAVDITWQGLQADDAFDAALAGM